MSHATIGREQTEEEILNYEVSDEALETAAETGQQKAAIPTAPFAIICIPFAE